MGLLNNEMALGADKMVNYSDQVAVITGGSRGLGSHIATSLAQRGIKVIFTYKSKGELAKAVNDEIISKGGQCEYHQLDVSNETQVQDFFELIAKQNNHIDILINNAGISIDGVTWKLTSENWQSVIDTNLKGTFLCTKYVLPCMRSNGYGRIVSMTSVVAQDGVAGAGAYAASKAGIIGFTKSVAKEVASKGITVNALALGYFDEGMLYTIAPEILTRLKEQIPMKRFGQVEELLWAIHFLCAPQAGYITGEVININGGYYMG